MLSRNAKLIDINEQLFNIYSPQGYSCTSVFYGLSPLPEILLKYKNPNFIAVGEHTRAVESSNLAPRLSVTSRQINGKNRFFDGQHQ